MSNKIYKCIKKYPDGPKIGATAVEGSIGYRTLENGIYNKKDIENYPEFWELIIEKEWEIITAKIHTATVRCDIDGIQCISGWEIKSIKRLSDNTIFSIGDKIKVSCHEKNESPEIITKIELNKEGNPCLFTSKFCNNGIDLFKSVKYKKIITTDDGVDLYKNDYFWHVDPYFSVSKGVLDTTCPEFSPLKGYKHFSTEKAAKDWLEINKPKYSLNKIQNTFKRIGWTHEMFIIFRDIIK